MLPLLTPGVAAGTLHGTWPPRALQRYRYQETLGMEKEVIAMPLHAEMTPN